jgi:RimJ/RimL family protein N-acetyltransferase
MGDLFRGKLVRLAAEEPETMGAAMSRWARDSEYFRLLDSSPAYLWSEKWAKGWLEREEPGGLFFSIRVLEDNRLIGFIGLFGFQSSHREAWVGIGLGERDYWGKGYGTDAMNVILRYAFMELDLYRVTLDTFEYNPRAIRSYQKSGFCLEGCLRGGLNREGQRWDMLIMGILREEWERSIKGVT